MDTSTLYIVAGIVLVAAFAYTDFSTDPDVNAFTSGERVYHQTDIKSPKEYSPVTVTSDSFVPERGTTAYSSKARVGTIYSD